MRLRVLALLIFSLIGYFLVWPAIRPAVAATALILDITGQAPTVRKILPVPRYAVSTRDLDVPARHGAIHARLYLPATSSHQTVVMFPGVHGGGVDEPRMSALARKFAETGLTVLAAPLPELRRYVVRPRSTDDIEDVTLWAAGNPELAPHGRVALVGVSFAGGLALVAAGRPSLHDKIAFVAAMGSHGDLPRAMKYLLTGVLPNGTEQLPNDYGSVVIFLAGLHHLVPPDQVDALRAAVLHFLDASSLDVTDPPGSARMFAEARVMGDALPEPARTVMRWVNDRNTQALGPKLLPYIEELGGDSALSPERSPATMVPVFLLHGSHDNVIPYTETPRLADYLRAQGNTAVVSLLTPLISHANFAASPRAADVLALVRFWASMLNALPAT